MRAGGDLQGRLNRIFRGKKWCGFRLPDHVNYFTPTSLVGMSKAIGFHIAQFEWRDKLPTSDNMWIVIQKHSTANNTPADDLNPTQPR